MRSQPCPRSKTLRSRGLRAGTQPQARRPCGGSPRRDYDHGLFDRLRAVPRPPRCSMSARASGTFCELHRSRGSIHSGSSSSSSRLRCGACADRFSYGRRIPVDGGRGREPSILLPSRGRSDFDRLSQRARAHAATTRAGGWLPSGFTDLPRPPGPVSAPRPFPPDHPGAGANPSSATGARSSKRLLQHIFSSRQARGTVQVTSPRNPLGPPGSLDLRSFCCGGRTSPPARFPRLGSAPSPFLRTARFATWLPLGAASRSGAWGRGP